MSSQKKLNKVITTDSLQQRGAWGAAPPAAAIALFLPRVGGPTRSQLRVCYLSANSWRICDPRYRRHPASPPCPPISLDEKGIPARKGHSFRRRIEGRKGQPGEHFPGFCCSVCLTARHLALTSMALARSHDLSGSPELCQFSLLAACSSEATHHLTCLCSTHKHTQGQL